MIYEGDGVTMVIPPQKGYRETREFRTQISTAFSGREWRDSFHEDDTQDLTPLRTVQYPVKSRDRQELQWIENLLTKGQTTEIRVPLWLSRSTLTQDTDGTATIYLDTTDREFSTDLEVLVVRQNLSNYVVRSIQTINAGNLILTATVPSGFTAGEDWVMPLLDCFLPKEAKLQSEGSLHYGRGLLKLQELKGAYPFTQPSETLFQGFPIWGFNPERNLAISVLNDMELAGGRYQARKTYHDAPPEREIGFPFSLGSMNDRQTLRTFFDARLGRYRAFWTRSYKQDLELGVAASSGASVLDLIPSGELTGLDSVTRWVYSRDLEDQYLASSPTVNGNYIRVDISPNLSGDLALAAHLENFFLVRLDKDALTLQFGDLGPDRDGVTVQMKEVQAETPSAYTP